MLLHWLALYGIVVLNKTTKTRQIVKQKYPSILNKYIIPFLFIFANKLNKRNSYRASCRPISCECRSAFGHGHALRQSENVAEGLWALNYWLTVVKNTRKQQWSKKSSVKLDFLAFEPLSWVAVSIANRNYPSWVTTLVTTEWPC